MQDYTTHPLFERQLALEAEMVSRGKEAFYKKLGESKANHLESTTPCGSHLVRHALITASKGIQDFMDKANSGRAGSKHTAIAYLRMVSPDVAAFMALRTCLNMLSSKTTLQNVAITLANALETEVRLDHFEKANKKEYKNAARKVAHTSNERHKRFVFSYIAGKNNVELPSWPKRDKLLLGQKLIEIIAETTGYIEIITDRCKTGAKQGRPGAYTYHMVGSEKCLDWLAAHEMHGELATPDFLPTIIPPRPWTSPYEGGYYTVYKPINLVKTGSPNYMEELALSKGDMPVVYEAINAMQSTGYTINTQVLEVMQTLWDAGGDVAGIPHRDNYARPRCPFCGVQIPASQGRGSSAKHSCFTHPDAELVLKEWKREAAAIYEKNIATMSRRFQFAKALILAQRFKEEEAIYFPMQLDFRGRCYAVSSYLTPQGADHSKGLLLFAQGKPVASEDAVKWLTIHGANSWGEDKVSLDARYNWVVAQEKEILAVAANPYDNRMWVKADKPWQFLAFCFEWAAYKAAIIKGETPLSHLPVAMDGTCNGLQIFSLMLMWSVKFGGHNHAAFL